MTPGRSRPAAKEQNSHNVDSDTQVKASPVSTHEGPHPGQHVALLSERAMGIRAHPRMPEKSLIPRNKMRRTSFLAGNKGGVMDLTYDFIQLCFGH